MICVARRDLLWQLRTRHRLSSNCITSVAVAGVEGVLVIFGSCVVYLPVSRLMQRRRQPRAQRLILPRESVGVLDGGCLCIVAYGFSLPCHSLKLSHMLPAQNQLMLPALAPACIFGAAPAVTMSDVGVTTFCLLRSTVQSAIAPSLLWHTARRLCTTTRAPV
jgi:hypothetical protein